MKKAIATILLVMTIESAQAAEMKYPQMYKQMLDAGHNVGKPYFQCDYTSKSCERGLIWNGHLRVFEMIDDADRTTVIGHGGCSWNVSGSWVCWNFDNGTYRGVINGSQKSGDMTVEDRYDWPRPIW
jgi:hypothetical protein